MINFENVNKYCRDDIRLIENYEAAFNDPTQTWDCHHRLETELGLSMAELNDRNLYYNRPASELIFLTSSEHIRLHQAGKNVSCETKKKQSDSKKREKHPMWGKKQSKESNKKRSQSLKGKLKDRPWMNNGITRVRAKSQEEIEHYRSLGYDFGFKLKT